MEADSISCVPPRSADCCCNSLPSWESRELADLHLAPALRQQDLREFLHAKADGMVGVVEVSPPDRPLLDLLGGCA